MHLHLTNTLTKQKEVFTPEDMDNVRMYNCGVTPYDYAHIGNARNAVAFDVLFRILRQIYTPENVTYVRNFTDVDDKIIARAAEVNTTEKELSQKFIQAYQADMAALGCLTPTHEPLVTEEIPAICTIVNQLLANGYAYVTETSDVNYDISKKADYGKLSRKKLDELVAGVRIDEDNTKRNPGDFALWKAAKKGEPTWDLTLSDGTILKGRPGWHIECSAMSAKYLGKTFDIHTGGEDLQFPHHENEIAQSEGAHAKDCCDKKHVNYWLHNAFITVGGKRMGKSLGNFTTVRDALEHYDGRAIRLWLLQTHYRKPVDFSQDALKASQKRLRRLHNAIADLDEGIKPNPDDFVKILKPLADDMNTSKAIAQLDILRAAASKGEATAAATLKQGMMLLGLL